MSFFINPFQLLERGVGIDLCRIDTLMTQQFLDALKSCTVVQHRRGESVPEHVGRALLQGRDQLQVFMEIKIQSIHFDATEKLEAFIEKKVAKLEKSFEDIQKVEVQLKVVKPATAQNKEASLSVAVPGSTLFVEKTSDTFEESIDLCVDSMRSQLQKFKEKLRNR